MSHNVSVVNIIASEHRDAINVVAAMFDCGANSMSVALVNANGVSFYGCHSWWTADAYMAFTDDEMRNWFIDANCEPAQATAIKLALASLYESVVVDGDAQTNWQAALAELELTVVEVLE